MKFHCSVAERKGAREKEERGGESERRRGLYARAGLAVLPDPASCQRHGQSASRSAWKGWEGGGGDALEDRGRG